MERLLGDPKPEETPRDWFIRAKNDTVNALLGLEDRMSADEANQAEELAKELIAVYSREERPLTTVLHSAAKLYAFALQISLENLAEPGVTIH